MTKKIILLLASITLILILAACQKKEEQTKPQVQSPMAQPSDLSQQMKSPEMVPPHGNMNQGKKEERTVLVPDDVKKSWGKVKLVFTDKTSSKSKEYTIDIGSSVQIPGTGLKIMVMEFLPDFKMRGSTITSGSNETINPAAHVEIFENGQSIFKGWLYSKFPDIHPFEHDKYAVKLKEGVRK